MARTGLEGDLRSELSKEQTELTASSWETPVLSPSSLNTATGVLYRTLDHQMICFGKQWQECDSEAA